jgi:Mrp family chromosome partitioning ATPase
MFATFYSYKGGVGRSLALANVAWLLANHPTEPARVLAIDLDLNAPGLHKILDILPEREALGMVDFVRKYMDDATVDDLHKYIHATRHPNIDIIPAGLFNENYQSQLEEINWRELYESAHGYEFINHFKAMINAIRPAYDYVLIDSLTGYSDIGGICVRQLPDCAVLVFRLNDQNLDGIQSVYKSVRATGSSSHSMPVIPVISPAWPFIDSKSAEWYEKARRIFASESLYQVSFDGGLSYGETIVSEYAGKDLPLTVLADYQKLTLGLRALNSTDPLTLWNLIRSNDGVDSFQSELERYLRLLKMRPNTAEYWHYMPNVVFPFRRVSSAKNKIDTAIIEFKAFVDRQCELRNKYALLSRGRFSQIWNPKARQANILDINQAVELDPSYVEALHSRGRLLLADRRAREAVVDLDNALSLISEGDYRRGRLNEDLGLAYLDLLDGSNAVRCYLQALRSDPKDPDLYAGLSRAYYLIGEYDKAMEEIEKLRSFYGDDELTGRLLPAQVLAAKGLIDEARERLDEIRKAQRKRRVSINTAEAYLAVDPKMALTFLETDFAGRASSPVKTLRIIARILLNRKQSLSATDVLDIEGERKSKKNSWNEFEVMAMLEAARRSGSLSERQIGLVKEAIDRLRPTLSIASALMYR